MRNSIRFLFITIVVTIWLPQILHGTTRVVRAEGRIQITKNNNHAVQFRIPEYFDLRGEKLNSLMEMLKERTKMLHENEMKRNEIHKQCLWLFKIILPAYALASIVWIIVNIIVYQWQRHKLESSGEANSFNRNQERERLLERYNQIPSADLPFTNRSTSPITELNCGSNLNDTSVHSSFEANRARVEAILKRNNEPQFMRRI